MPGPKKPMTGEDLMRLSTLLISTPFALKALQYQKNPLFVGLGVLALSIGVLYNIDQFEKDRNIEGDSV